MSEIGMVLFKKKIQEYLQDYLNDYEGFENCSIDISDVVKENQTLPAVIVRKAGTNMSPTIYLNKYFIDFVEGRALDDILQDIAEVTVKGYRDCPDFGNIKEIMSNPDNVICELVNTKWNAHLIKNIPHRNIGDLSLIYRIRVSDEATFLVTGKMLSEIGMNEEQLYEAAMRNTVYKIVSMKDMLAELMGMEPEELEELAAPEMYILTNENKVYGAAAIVNEEILAAAMEKMNAKDIIILPSSIHEVIAVPGWMDPDEMREMVQEINRTQVPENERLSDNVYRYDKENGLKIIKSIEHERENIREKPDREM